MNRLDRSFQIIVLKLLKLIINRLFIWYEYQIDSKVIQETDELLEILKTDFNKEDNYEERLS